MTHPNVVVCAIRRLAGGPGSKSSEELLIKPQFEEGGGGGEGVKVAYNTTRKTPVPGMMGRLRVRSFDQNSFALTKILP